MRLLPAVLLASVLSWTASGQTYTISTFAGGALPVNIPGTSASISPGPVAVDRAGNVFFADQYTILRLDATTGILTLVAGNGTTGFSGDNGPAISSQLSSPAGLAVDSAGDLYIADAANRVRKVSNGVITTVVGNGTQGFSGDNGSATSAQLNAPTGVAVDSAGNLYIADRQNNRIRKVSSGVITTVAGNGTPGFSGDNGPATSAQLYYPSAITVDSAGNLYIDDALNQRIRKVSNGVVTTVAGNGTPGFSGDNGPATSAQLNNPSGVAVDSAGNLYIADQSNNRIRKVSNGVITTVAGNGTLGYGGDGGPATSAQLTNPYGVAVDAAGNLYIADFGSSRIRKVSNGVITTVAGNGTQDFSGDNGPATSAQLDAPRGVAVDSAGNLYIVDYSNHRIRKVSNGIITTVAGNGTPGFSGDNGPATSAQLYYPSGIAVDSAGSLYIGDSNNNRIRKVSNGVITTVAGNGAPGFSGDNGPAISSQLNFPCNVAVDSAGNLYIDDDYNYRVRKVSTNGVITTIAGAGTSGFPSGTRGLAASANLFLAVDSAGDVYIAVVAYHLIYEVSNGVLTTVAGTGTPGFSGDNGPATSAQLNWPRGLAVDPTGSLYIADSVNNRIRKVSNGVITTVAGGGAQFGDNGPATSAGLSEPFDVAVDLPGDVYIADTNNNRIRLLTPSASACTYSVTPTTLQAPASGGSLTPVSIQTTASCTWAVTGLPSWITVSGASSGAGSAAVTLVVAPDSGAAQSATIQIAGVSVTIKQAAAAGAPLPTINAVVNAASFIGGSVSPGELVTIFGTAIGPATPAGATIDPSTGRLATTIGGVQVLFNGVPAPMIYASGTQVSAVVPYEIAPVPNPSVWIQYAGQTSNVYGLTTAATAPGMFTQNASGGGPGAILNQDNSLNRPGNAAAKGSIVQMFLTGEGQTNPPSVTGAITTATLPPPQVTPAPPVAIQARINGQPALYTYAGEAPGQVAGVMQLNVEIPLSAPSGNLSITVSIGGNISQNGVTVSVQ
jgi:uncharacterized protein (TIGR03437 family)